MNKNQAFTLAEVLITLAIIGVVAALTIPSLIKKYEIRHTMTALKEIYSVMDQAAKLTIAENGTPDTWYSNVTTGLNAKNEIMLNKFKPYLRITKICQPGEQGCFTDVMYKKIDGKDTRNWNRNNSDIISFRLNNGMLGFLLSYGINSKKVNDDLHYYGVISIDVNGAKRPNVFGRDVFSLMLTERGIIPFGLPGEYMNGAYDQDEDGNWTIPITDVKQVCNRTDCLGYCEGCAAWIIYKGNMDYLFCDDLSWDGKTSCSEKN